MAKPENVFIASVHRHLPPESELHREGMANPYRGGTADCWYSGKRDLWIEWKFIKVPARDNTLIDIGLSPLQQDWLMRRYKEGRNVWVGVGSAEGGVFFEDTLWRIPCNAGSFRAWMDSRKRMAEQITEFVQGRSR